MSYRWRHLLNQLPIAFGMRSDRRLKTTRLKHAQFVSYLEDSGFRTHNVDHHERSLRRRRVVKTFLLVATAFGAAWVIMESARAVVLF
ncbi:MAG: hypothetical protein WCR49_07300 [Opitutae bacterium]|jgi:hypothetical protein